MQAIRLRVIHSTCIHKVNDHLTARVRIMDSIEESKESYISKKSMTSLQHVSLLSSGLTRKEQIKLHCKPTYRLRKVKNKGAILVIVWSYLITNICYFVLASEGYMGLFIKLGMVAVGLTLPIAGWLSDIYFGRYKVIRFSMCIMWIAIILATASSVVAQFVDSYEYIISYMYGTLMTIATVGLGGFLGNLIQFGIDQLHNAPTNEITSFITWYVCKWILCSTCSSMFMKNIRNAGNLCIR